MKARPKGDYVLASDYDALAAENARLRALLQRAHEAASLLCNARVDCRDMLVDIEKELAHGE